VIIVRCGFSTLGKIWFDNVSLTIVSAGSPKEENGTAYKGEGFRFDERPLKHLQSLRNMSENWVAEPETWFNGGVKVRRDIFAQGDDKYQIVIYLDLSEVE